MSDGAYLLTYFAPETAPDGEQIRFAVSDPDDPSQWSSLAGGRPALVSAVGEGGARDPFLLRDPDSGLFILIATDLRIYPDQDWSRATTAGSRSVVIWDSADLVTWSPPRLVEVAPREAGNTWAPKAFWSKERNAWLLIWASAITEQGAWRHQRLLAAETFDFQTFGAPETYHDPGHTVIDATFLVHGEHWYRFSANSLGERPGDDRGHHILMERGTGLEDPRFTTVVEDIGKPELRHAEGPAPFPGPRGDRWYLLIDENGYRGYQLYETEDLGSGRWKRRHDARIPRDARHGSVLPITLAERERLMAAFGEEKR